MRKKIILAQFIFTSIFVMGGIYLIITIQNATSSLNNLIKLHQVEILREQLVIGAKRVQSDLALHGTHYARTLDTIIDNVVEMNDQAEKCLGCHHSAVMTQKLKDMHNQIHVYQDSLSRFLTLRANASLMEEAEGTAFEEGHVLIDMLNDMTLLTKARLEKRTEVTLIKIGEMKTLIFILIILGPIIALSLATVFTHELTKPFSLLLQATRKLKGGDLNFSVQGLTDEFGEMEAALDEMSASLRHQIRKMRRVEQMTMVGEMAAGLVHEIKNPLAGIKGSLQFLQEEAHLAEEEKMILLRVIDEAERVELLLKSLLDFARPPKPEPVPVNMNDILARTLAFAQPSFPSGKNSANQTVIQTEFDLHLPATMADPLGMKHVFLNLLMNAAEAMPTGGTLTVRTSVNEPAREIQIEIADTGKGIKDELREKVFQPFFTTKSKGTGLGLAICKQIVEMHDGTISAVQNPEGGTIFRILLPITEGEEASEAPA